MNNSWRKITGDIKHKFKAKPVNHAGEHFRSTLEFNFKQHLDLLQKHGEIIFYLMQVPLRLPGGTKYIVDFLIFWKDGRIAFVDTKGMETETFKIKKREIEAIYPFTIEIIKKGDF